MVAASLQIIVIKKVRNYEKIIFMKTLLKMTGGGASPTFFSQDPPLSVFTHASTIGSTELTNDTTERHSIDYYMGTG